ncbi:MAG TPA: glycosyltransferase [Chitinivibrionales bacterium]|nr:glycosyltransferase [Chitinivibrionales bacterium]
MNPVTAYRNERMGHWNALASKRKTWLEGGKRYHKRLRKVYSYLIPPGKRVLEIGCGYGGLIAAVKPSIGVGVDFSRQTLLAARKKHPEITFVCADGHRLGVKGAFDAIVLSDLVNDLWDVQELLQGLAPLCTPKTRLIINSYSRLWELPLGAASLFGMKRKNLQQNWLTVEDIANLLVLAGFEMIRSWQEVLFPFSVKVLEPFCNKILVKIWPFSVFALTNMIVARPDVPVRFSRPPSVSVVVPARNEAGNIERIFSTMPAIENDSEIIFVEGNSKDRTYTAIEDAMKRHPSIPCRLLKQTGKGKGDAVRLGFSQARGDILMVLDADLTVAAEDLVRFYDAIVSGKGEFINGVRLVYPLEKGAMQLLNFFGNKFFGLAFSWLLGQPVKDTLCGTKVLWRTDYEIIAKNRGYFGDFDPFGDFDLLFGAARLNLKIVDMPIRYQERKYGTTNISRWRHGMLLIRMVAFALNKIKFV